MSRYHHHMDKLVLFDIDGTLVRSRGAGRTAIHQALLEEFGNAGPIEDMRFDGKTDPQIVTELLVAVGHPGAHDLACVRRVCDVYLRRLEFELTEGEGEVWPLEGVPDLLDALERRNDAVLGLLTGNIERGAELKLRRAGLAWNRFRVGAFGSDAAARPDLPPVAVARAEPVMGRAPAGHDVVIIGDTPADMTCGRSVGARAIGVATGFYSREDLAASGAFRVLPDLADTDAVIEAIFA